MSSVWKSGVVKHYLEHTDQEEVVLTKYILRSHGVKHGFYSGPRKIGRFNPAKRCNGVILAQICRELRDLMDHSPEDWIVVDIDPEAPSLRAFKREYLEKLVRSCDSE